MQKAQIYVHFADEGTHTTYNYIFTARNTNFCSSK